MKLVIGLVTVLACVLGGFVLHHGNLMALFVPTEYLIIGGCLVGGMIVKNSGRTLKSLLGDLAGLLKGGEPGPPQYLQLFQMLYELLNIVRRESPLALEPHANDPNSSSVLSKYPFFLADHHAVAFLCDSLKLFIEGSLSPHQMDELMERDLEVLHHEAMEPSHALSNAADSLPAIGIVAAVLGIILTMSAIDEGAAAVGAKVAGALVGTFLGVFMAYGFVAPMAGALEAGVNSRGRYHDAIRHVLMGAISGFTPNVAVEVGRRSIHGADRPTFEELEEALRQVKG